MLNGADKQCSSLYAVHFMFLAFPDGVENGQNVNFSKFTHVGTWGSLYVVIACSTVRISNVVHYMLSISCS